MLYGDSQEMMEGPEILHGESRLRADMVCCRSVALDAVRTMSSPQSNKYMVSEPHRMTNKEVSDLISTNPKEVMYVANRLYQARGTCFSMYRDLLRRQT
jgi:hypothetical protein